MDTVSFKAHFRMRYLSTLYSSLCASVIGWILGELSLVLVRLFYMGDVTVSVHVIISSQALCYFWLCTMLSGIYGKDSHQRAILF